MLDFSENGNIEVSLDDIILIEQLERDERIIAAVRAILEQRKTRQ